MTPLLMTVRMVAALSSPHQVSSGCTLVLGGIPVGLLKLHPDINLHACTVLSPLPTTPTCLKDTCKEECFIHLSVHILQDFTPKISSLPIHGVMSRCVNCLLLVLNIFLHYTSSVSSFPCAPQRLGSLQSVWHYGMVLVVCMV